MIQCSGCEHFRKGDDGRVSFKCDPFSTIKEPECLLKWQLLRMTDLTQKIDRMVAAYEATLEMYRRIQPLQEKMFRHMEHEMDDLEEGEAWKEGGGEDDDEDEPEAPWSGSDPQVRE